MTGRLARQSTHTPAARPTASTGAVPAAASAPIWNGVAPRVKAATSGNASAVTADPTPETTLAPHSRTNAGERQTPPGCRRF